ncbi:hypothetical protein COSO111634_33435 [Corallococcus soli]
MNASRSRGYAASSGTYAAPALRMPSIPSTIPTPRSTHSPTREPRPTPSFRSRFASWFARVSTCRYVRCVPAKSNATASGVRSTCAVTSVWTHCCLGYAVRVAFHATTCRWRSSAVSSSSRATLASGFAAMPSSSTSRCPAIRSTVAASNRSVLYSIDPRNPFGVSISDSVSSYLAVRSSASIGNRDRPPGSFCSDSVSCWSANITWNSGGRRRSRSGARASTSFSNGTS